MIYLKLFINFLIIGTLSFGGGYGMISLMREIVLSNHWLSEDMFMSFVQLPSQLRDLLQLILQLLLAPLRAVFLVLFLQLLV